jgi:chromosomal replication initiation ATPase DnaA
MKNEKVLKLVDKIINTYCEKNKIERSFFSKRIARYTAKTYRNIYLYKHRQIMSLYFREVLKAQMVYVGPMLGYEDHSTMSKNVKKFKHLKEIGDVEINNLWNDMASWANEMIKKEYEKFADTSNL